MERQVPIFRTVRFLNVPAHYVPAHYVPAHYNPKRQAL
jgi:hypothetical protein